jgi:hypothetical protein
MTGGVIIFYIIYGFMLNDTNFFAPFLVLFCIMFVLSTFTYDDMAGWDMYAITLPTGKNKIVYAKYLISFIFALLGGCLFILISVLQNSAKSQTVSKTEFILIWGYIAAMLLINSIQIPLVIKMGSEKARFALIGIIFVPTLLVLGLKKLELLNTAKNILTELAQYYNLLLWISPILMILIVFLSIKLSIYIYKKKEF